jgi:hypothetical protein
MLWSLFQLLMKQLFLGKGQKMSGSLVIQPGCSFFALQKMSLEVNYLLQEKKISLRTILKFKEKLGQIDPDETITVPGPALIESMGIFMKNVTKIELLDTIGSSSCSCNLPPINCVPVEAFEAIVICDSLVLDVNRVTLAILN